MERLNQLEVGLNAHTVVWKVFQLLLKKFSINCVLPYIAYGKHIYSKILLSSKRNNISLDRSMVSIYFWASLSAYINHYLLKLANE